MGDSLTSISSVIKGLIIAIWALAIIIMIVAFTMISNERKKEFAIVRALGASKKMLTGIIFKEAFILSLLGSVIGCAAAACAAFLFRSFLENSLDLPFLLSSGGSLAALICASLIVSVLAGTLSAAVSASKISRMDTALILRGEN